jgi:hypothetical protein
MRERAKKLTMQPTTLLNFNVGDLTILLNIDTTLDACGLPVRLRAW